MDRSPIKGQVEGEGISRCRSEWGGSAKKKKKDPTYVRMVGEEGHGPENSDLVQLRACSWGDGVRVMEVGSQVTSEAHHRHHIRHCPETSFDINERRI